MGKECVIFGCTNRDTDMLPGVKFHRIPSAEPRRSMWIKAINRKDCTTGKDWSPGDKSARICSEHFLQGLFCSFILVFSLTHTVWLSTGVTEVDAMQLGQTPTPPQSFYHFLFVLNIITTFLSYTCPLYKKFPQLLGQRGS